MEMTYVRKRIEEASNLVCLLGISTSMDCGCLNYRQEDGCMIWNRSTAMHRRRYSLLYSLAHARSSFLISIKRRF